MTVEKVGIGRSRVQYTGDRLQIIIPSKKNLFAILLLPAWLGGWAFGEVSVIRTLFFDASSSAPSFFLFFWLTGWTVGGAFALFIFLWLIAGKEIISLSQGLLRVDKKVFGIGSSKQYSLTESKRFRVSATTNWFGSMNSGLEWWGYGGGRLSFDYGMKTIKFANGIDEAEANFLIDEMKKYNFIEA